MPWRCIEIPASFTSSVHGLVSECSNVQHRNHRQKRDTQPREFVKTSERWRAYRKSLKKARRRAANAPVESCWTLATATLSVALAAAEVAAALAEPPAPDAAVEEALAPPAADV